MGKKVLITAQGHANMTDLEASTLADAVEVFRTALLAAIPDAKLAIQQQDVPTPAT